MNRAQYAQYSRPFIDGVTADHIQWRRSQVKSGGKIEKSEGVGLGRGALPVGGLGACPQKKINFALKIMQF